MNRCIACARHVASRWSRCPWCRGWTGQARDPSDSWRDARLDGLRVFGLCLAAWMAALAYVRNSLTSSDAWIVAAVAAMVGLGHLALPWHELGWYLAEVGWGAAAVLTPFVFRADPVSAAAQAAALPLAIFVSMRCMRWPLLDRLHGQSPREEAASRLVTVLRTETRGITMGIGLMAGLVLLPILAALIFPD